MKWRMIGLRRVRYCDFTISLIWLEIAYSRLFGMGMGIFPPNGVTLPFILTPKGTSLRENTSFEPLSVCARAAGEKIKTVKKSQKYYISHI